MPRFSVVTDSTEKALNQALAIHEMAGFLFERLEVTFLEWGWTAQQSREYALKLALAQAQMEATRLAPWANPNA